jgi:hypothetical protein
MPVAQQAGHRHAVQVAAGADRLGVDVGVRVEPDHAQLLAAGTAVARHGADRADRQAVVAAHQQRHVPLGESLVHRAVHGPVPGDDLIEVPHAALLRLPGIGRPREVAAIDDVQAMRAQRFRQAGHAQRVGAHARAAHAGADVGGRADQAHGLAAAHRAIVRAMRAFRGGMRLAPHGLATEKRRTLPCWR